MHVLGSGFNQRILIHIKFENMPCAETMEKQLFSSSLLKLWRTEVDRLLYSSFEDGDCDVSCTSINLYYYILLDHILALENTGC